MIQSRITQATSPTEEQGAPQTKQPLPLRQTEFQGIAYSLAFITEVLLQSSLDKLGLHIRGSGTSCSMSVMMCLYVSLQGPNTNALASQNLNDLVLFKL